MSVLDATSAATSHGEQVIETVRSRIAVEDRVLVAARDRRDRVDRAAMQFPGALRCFGSGSLAHRTVNRPLKDADLGLALDRRSWPSLGPDGSGGRPEAVMQELASFVLARLRVEYPHASCDVSGRRAILFEFGREVHGVDPSVDLVICLTRLERPGFWIPNTKSPAGWDASDSERHTALMTAEPKALRVYRARVVRLAKAAVGGDLTPIMFSWNISALALEHITETHPSLLVGLGAFLHEASVDIDNRLTPDPARVAPAPISLPPGIDQERASFRLSTFARHCFAAGEARSRQGALAELVNVFPDQLHEAPRSRKRQIAEDLKRPDRATGAAAAAFGAMPPPTLSDGCA